MHKQFKHIYYFFGCVEPNFIPSCKLCDAHLEESKTLFYKCDIALVTWRTCYSWLNIQTIFPVDTNMHYWQHQICKGNKQQNRRWRIIWGAIAWALWKHRKNFIKNKSKWLIIWNWKFLKCKIYGVDNYWEKVNS